MVFPFLKYRTVAFIFSGTLAVAAILAIALFGLKFGIDFTGGSVLHVEYQENRPAVADLNQQLASADLGEFSVQPLAQKGLIVRVQGVGDKVRTDALEKLGRDKVKELSFDSIGPVIGQELRQKTIVLTILSLLAIFLYIVFAFRAITWPVSSWQYGLAALIALAHDLLITSGFIVALGYFFDVPITIPLVIALLTLAGYSVNDTIVIFDRTRENLLRHRELNFSEVINVSLSQTFVRSVNTYLTVIFVLAAIFFFGGESLKYFSLSLIAGIFMGAYSSIFIAAPLLTLFKRGRLP